MRLISRLSLTARLTLLFATVSCAVLLALGWVIDASIEHHFELLDRDALTGKLMLAQHVIERVTTPQGLERLPDQLRDGIVGHHDLIFYILGPDKEVMIASSDLKFPEDRLSAASVSADPQMFSWKQGENSYRGLAAAVQTHIQNESPLLVAVAVDMGHHIAFMQTFMRTLWLFVVCAAATTGLLGWLAVRRGLAPLRTMREKAALVTAHRLDHRVPVDAVPAELADLAITLNEMLARLEDAFKRLSDFSSDIAHELRTPVNNLMTQTQVSLSRARDAASYRDILESNSEEFERLARMIADMLLLAKAENGLVVPNRENVSVATEVTALFDYYDAVAEDKGLHLCLEGDAHVDADRLMLRRAIGNLLSNAVRHASAKTKVRVVVKDDPGGVEIQIENTGEVIAAEHLDRIFDRFFRVDPSRQHSNEGTGLGLAITKSIVMAHGGEITASSDGALTRFTLWLPRVFPLKC